MRAATAAEARRILGPEVADRILSFGKAFVSLSGGVDSCAVLALAAGLLPPESLTAVHFSSWLHPLREGRRAEELCRTLGVEFRVFSGPELQVPQVMHNHPSRCGDCKAARLAFVESTVRSAGAVLLDGTNADDVKDPTRLGNRVLKNCPFIYSPFAEAGLDKAAVRQAARELGIPWADEPATACMATRFPRGVALNEEECRRVASAEETLAEAGITARLRVFGDTVCLEFPRPLCWEWLPIEAACSILKRAGYDRVTVDAEGYRTGREWLSGIGEVLNV